MKLKNSTITPPGGFRDICPDTGFPFFADSLVQLIEKEIAHLKANNLKIAGNLAEVIENRLCHNMPPEICKSTDGEKYHGRSRRAEESIVNKTIRLDRGISVAQSVADKRAKVCANCPHNVIRRTCGSCRGVSNILQSILRGRTTSINHRLGVCDVIGVYNKVLCHCASLTGITVDVKGCWINKKGA